MIERAIMANITQASLEGNVDQIDRARELLDSIKVEGFIDYDKISLYSEPVNSSNDHSLIVEPIAIFGVPETLEVLKEKTKVYEKLDSEIEDPVLKGKVKGAINRIAREYKISRPEDICNISDEMLMRVSMVGPSLIAELRKFYPVDLT